MVTYYDNQPLEPTDDGWIDLIERIYCFDWARFDKVHWKRLEEIMAMLPEPRSGSNGWAWYSDQEDIESGYLHGSVEPPGLQVYGTLKLETWQEWDRAFQSLVDALPMRELK